MNGAFLTHYKTINIIGENHQFNLFSRCSQIIIELLKHFPPIYVLICGITMKVFVIFSVLAASAMSARLDNTYIPPASAQSAGGFNLDTPKLALASNVQNQYSAPAGGRVQNQYQQQSYQQPGLNQGTFTSVSKGNGFQSISVGSQSSQGGYKAPQQAYQQQSSYQQPQQSYQPQAQYNGYQQQAGSGYNTASTTPIPILKCKQKTSENLTRIGRKCQVQSVKKENIMLSEVTTLNVRKCQKWL